MCTFFHLQKNGKIDKQRSRKCDIPATTYDIRIPNQSIPEITIHDSVKTNFNYFTPEYIMDLKSAQKFSEIVSSFFATEIVDASPYTFEEWKEILHSNKENAKNKERICSSLYHGYPQELRREIWFYLAETKQLKEEYSRKGITYEKLKSQDCAHTQTIKKDIIRSFSDHEFFRENKQEKLMSIQNILEAYANFDPEVGYTQGLNFVAGMLLYFLQTEYEAEDEAKIQEEVKEEEIPILQEKFEDEVFWVLVYIMQEKDWRMSYVVHTPRLQELLDKLEDMMSAKLPDVHKLLVEHNCLPACFSQYFLTIMIFYSPPALAKKVFEAFLVVGEEILLHVLIEILTHAKQTILEKQEMAELYGFLRHNLLKSI